MKKLSDDEVRLRLKAAPGWQKVRGELKRPMCCVIS